MKNNTLATLGLFETMLGLHLMENDNICFQIAGGIALLIGSIDVIKSFK